MICPYMYFEIINIKFWDKKHVIQRTVLSKLIFF